MELIWAPTKEDIARCALASYNLGAGVTSRLYDVIRAKSYPVESPYYTDGAAHVLSSAEPSLVLQTLHLNGDGSIAFVAATKPMESTYGIEAAALVRYYWDVLAFWGEILRAVLLRYSLLTLHVVD
jgi:hypothetical protein